MLRILKQLLFSLMVSMFASQASAMFIQADTLDPTKVGVGTNRYQYSGNDPINKLDPGGNEFVGVPGYYDEAAAGVGIAFGIIGVGIGVTFGKPGFIVDLPPFESPPPYLDDPLNTPAIPTTGAITGGSILSSENQPGAITISTPVEDGEISITVDNSGSYTIDFPDGSRYHGKGSLGRAKRSARAKAKTHGYDLGQTDIDWSPSENDRDAFKDEDDRIQGDDGVENPGNHNKINSPGKRYKEEDGNG